MRTPNLQNVTVTRGLVGIIGDGSAAELQAMAARMSYRGEARIWSPAPRVHLGELSTSASGSISNEGASSALALDYNGWLYDLAEPDAMDPQTRLQSERQRLEADLSQRRLSALAEVTGFFALAFWDAHSQSLTLACDRQGYKRLYFVVLEGRLAFASDIKALLALSDCPARIDRNILHVYLRSRSFSSVDSLLEAAQPVGRARAVTVGLDLAPRLSTYWRPMRGRRIDEDFNGAARRLRALLESVLRGQLGGHDRFGVALSGGLDSAAVLALAKHVRPDAAIATYTIGHGEQDIDIVRARRAATHFRSEHHETFYDIEQIPADLKRFVWLSEDLTGREEAILQQRITAVAGMRENLLLAGHGADAALAGMPRHRLLWLRDRAPLPLRHALSELFTYTQSRREPSSWLGRGIVALRFGSNRPMHPQVIGAVQSAEPSWPPLGTYRRDTVNCLESLRYHEPIDASCGIMLAAPFLDPAVIQFSLDCPTRYLINGFRQKQVLRQALQGVAPPQIVGLGKTIQRLRHDARLTELLHDFARVLRVEQSLAERGVLDAAYLTRAFNYPYKAGSASDQLHILWTLICTELWFNQFIDARGALLEES
jgi:asparagine synthase (glutamine-hydrolysing)